MARTRDLSPRQERLLSFIREYWREHGYAPSTRDMQEGCDITSTSVVTYNLSALKKRGLIDYEDLVSRTVRLRLQPGECCPVCGGAQ